MKPRARLVRVVSKDSGMAPEDVAAVLEAVVGRVLHEVKAARRCAWPGFGVFRRTTRAARRVRNPATGELMRIPRSHGVGFRVARSERRRL